MFGDGLTMFADGHIVITVSLLIMHFIGHPGFALMFAVAEIAVLYNWSGNMLDKITELKNQDAKYLLWYTQQLSHNQGLNNQIQDLKKSVVTLEKLNETLGKKVQELEKQLDQDESDVPSAPFIRYMGTPVIISTAPAAVLETRAGAAGAQIDRVVV
jgi:hypothetical protein